MNFWQRLLLAIIQSVLEWLPVSSEGFLVLTSVNLFNVEPSAAISIALYFHLGTAIAVFFKYPFGVVDQLNYIMVQLCIARSGSMANLVYRSWHQPH